MREGWKTTEVPEGGDCRKLVTLQNAHGLIWVGIRAWAGNGWLNNGEREKSEVIAWRDLPPPAYSDGLMGSMSGPTLPACDG